MTNEEIEKRFEFELGIGAFKPIFNKKDVIYAFYTFSNYELKILSTILEKLGYNNDKNSTNFYKCQGISIKIHDKKFWYFGDFIKKVEKNENTVPSYIMKYKI